MEVFSTDWVGLVGGSVGTSECCCSADDLIDIVAVAVAMVEFSGWEE